MWVGGVTVTGEPAIAIVPSSGWSTSITYPFVRACSSAKIAPSCAAGCTGTSLAQNDSSHSPLGWSSSASGHPSACWNNVPGSTFGPSGRTTFDRVL